MARRNLRPLLVPIGLALALVLAAPAQASVLGPRAPHSPNAEDIRTTYWVMLAVATVLFLAVNLALVAVVLRFREGRGREPARFTAGRGVFMRASVPLGVLAVAIFVFGVVMTERTREVEPTGPSGLSASSGLVAQVGGLHLPPADGGEPLEIAAIAQQWIWRFEYPGGVPGNKVFTYNELVVPVDTTVILNLDSTDVTHRWFVPALGGQVDAVPGSPVETWFRADREGTYPGNSTVYSGTGYPVMRPSVRVVSPSAYEAFIKQQREDLAAAQTDVQERLEQGATGVGETPTEGETSP